MNRKMLPVIGLAVAYFSMTLIVHVASPPYEPPAPTATATLPPPILSPVSLSTPWVPTPWVWLEPDEVQYVAGIVAGEAAHTYECYLVVACNILWDIKAGLPVEELAPGRWCGWKVPDDAHIGAVEFALTDGCVTIPRCEFLGNLDDLELWRSVGWATDEDYPSWTDRWGMTSVCVTE